MKFMKKKQLGAVEVPTEVSVNASNPEILKDLAYGIQPLELELSFGREDLNQAVGKIQDKINELIKKG